MRSRRPSAAGRRRCPEAVTEQKTGYKTADTLQSKVLVRTLAQKVPRNRSAIRANTSEVSRTRSASAIACSQRTIRVHRLAQRQGGKASGLSTMKGDEQSLGWSGNPKLNRRFGREVAPKVLTPVHCVYALAEATREAGRPSVTLDSTSGECPILNWISLVPSERGEKLAPCVEVQSESLRRRSVQQL
jgi:hypothetical protein